MKYLAATKSDQSIIINGFGLSGVTDISATYSIRKDPKNILGAGYVTQSLSGPPEASLSISRNMVSTDPLLNLTGDIGFSGTIDYLGKKLGFSSGYLNSYSISCQVGAVPSVEVDIGVFSDFGTGLVEAETGTHPSIQIPNQGSIFIECKGSGTNRITNFDYNVSINREPVYAVNSFYPADIVTQKPIEMSANFTISIADYETERMVEYLQSQNESDISIVIKAPDLSQVIQTFEIKNASLTSEAFSSSLDSEANVSLSYVGYSN